jgi:hypothetical protein
MLNGMPHKQTSVSDKSVFAHVPCEILGGPSPTDTMVEVFTDLGALMLPDDDDLYLKKITTRVSQNQILHKNEDQPKA